MAQRSWWIGGLVAAALVASVDARAQAPAVQGTQGQTAEQTAKDQGECAAAAKQSTGYDPAAAGAPTASSQPHVGGRVKGAAAGATAGAAAAGVRGRQHEAYESVDDDVKQEYRQHEAKQAAGAGAAVGAAKQRHERRSDRRETRSAEDELAAKKAAYDQAYKACLTGRGYTLP
jgi:hypothetical protein